MVCSSRGRIPPLRGGLSIPDRACNQSSNSFYFGMCVGFSARRVFRYLIWRAITFSGCCFLVSTPPNFANLMLRTLFSDVCYFRLVATSHFPDSNLQVE